MTQSANEHAYIDSKVISDIQLQGRIYNIRQACETVQYFLKHNKWQRLNYL